MTLQYKIVRGRRIRRKAAFPNTLDALKAATKTKQRNDEQTSLRPDILVMGHATLSAPFVDVVEIEWDTPALTIPPITETLLTMQIIEAAPRPMASIDALWLE